MTTTYLSVDIEADGPIPGRYSMLSFGVVAFNEDGEIISTFSRNLDLLYSASTHPETMSWWDENKEAYEATRVGTVTPSSAIQDVNEWMNRLPGRKTFVGYPASFDFMFFYWYLVAFSPYNYKCPFGFQALDIKTLAMAALKCKFREVGKRKMPKAWFKGQPKHDHNPVNDAIGQGMLFFEIMKDLKLEP